MLLNAALHRQKQVHSPITTATVTSIALSESVSNHCSQHRLL